MENSSGSFPLIGWWIERLKYRVKEVGDPKAGDWAKGQSGDLTREGGGSRCFLEVPPGDKTKNNTKT